MSNDLQKYIREGKPLPPLQPTIYSGIAFCKDPECKGVIREGKCVKCGKTVSSMQ